MTLPTSAVVGAPQADAKVVVTNVLYNTHAKMIQSRQVAEGKRLDESDLLRGVEARHELGQKVLHAAERRAQGRRERRRRGDVPVLGDVVELCVASVADLCAHTSATDEHM